MKSFVPYLVLLAMLSKVVRPEFDNGGYNTITTVTNDDPTSCLVTLSLQIFAKRIKFSATVIQNNYSDCTHHDIQYLSMFKGDNLNGAIVLTPTGNPNVKSANWTLADIAAYNGTACMINGYTIQNKSYYSCQFRYNNLIFSMDIGVDPVTGDFPTDGWFNLFNPSLGLTKKVVQNGIDVWKANITYPQVVGMLYNQCGSWSSIIPSLSTQFTVTGTELQSNTLNLHTLMDGFTWNVFWIRKHSGPATNYIAYPGPFPAALPFSSIPANNCSDMGMTYQTFLPDLNFCKGGCDMTMVFLINGSVYTFQTAGFAT